MRGNKSQCSPFTPGLCRISGPCGDRLSINKRNADDRLHIASSGLIHESPMVERPSWEALSVLDRPSRRMSDKSPFRSVASPHSLHHGYATIVASLLPP